jgi:putative peptidoglycan lipid II flippase
MAQLALIAYSVGLLGFMYVKVLSPGYFARQNTKTPMKIAIISMVAKIIVTLVLVLSMLHFSYEAPHVGLALATALSALFQSWLLYRGLVKDGIYTPDPGWFLYLLKIGLACTVMGVVLYYGVEDVFLWAKWSVYQRAFNILLWVGAGTGVYLLVLLITGVKIKELIKHG